MVADSDPDDDEALKTEVGLGIVACFGFMHQAWIDDLPSYPDLCYLSCALRHVEVWWGEVGPARWGREDQSLILAWCWCGAVMIR
jgi:hypothetical protein